MTITILHSNRAATEPPAKETEMIQIGTLIQIERATHAGTQTILGTVTMGEVTETGELTHITVEGQILTTRIGNMVIEEERPVTLEMIPVEPNHPHLLTVTEL